LGNLTQLLHKIKPAVELMLRKTDKLSIDEDFVDAVAEMNVHLTIQSILKQSPMIKDMIEKGEIEIAGGMYDVHTGSVRFYESS
jgi:carbonic anhydrase